MTAVVRKPRKLPAPFERFEQATFFAWLNTQFCEPTTGDVIRMGDYAYAIPNGSFLAGNATQRAIQANKLKQQGMKPGVQDINIDIPACGYHGLRIEMKRVGSDKPAAEQLEWHARARRMGYCVRVCYGFEEAKQAVLDYFTKGVGHAVG